jgi:murein DD-endopeptidase MepM/ murein hydrolase activator NlpD
VRITTGLPLSAVEVSWLDEHVRLPLHGNDGARSGEIILGTEVGEDTPGTHWIGVRALNGASLVHRRKVQVRNRDFPTQHLSLPEDSVTLSPPQLERYKTDKRAIRNALSSRTGSRFWSRPLLWPAHGEITSSYGLGRVLNGQKRSPHTGIDLALPAGTPVRATDAGRVALTGQFLFEGKAVFIDHGRGLVSMYFHLASIASQEGQMVARGEVIGHSGESGRGTGAHLHFGLSALDRLVNPLPLLRKQSAARLN